MAEIREELIHLYASDDAKNVLSSPEYKELCSKYKDNPRFDEERSRIEEAKSYLDTRLGNASIAEQVRRALKELNRLRRTREQSLYYDLIIHAYKPVWSQPQQQYFENAWRLISSEHDFFFSFTTRFRPPGGENPINRRYEYLIKKILGSARFKSADRSSKNLLAEALYQLLAERLYRGFLFTLHENDNAVTEIKLREACSSSLVFVQLVQNIMFEEPIERPNYCFFEHNEALKSIADEQRILFVIAEAGRNDLIPDFRVHPRYNDWYRHVTEKDPPYLEEVSSYSPQRAKELKDKFEAKVVRKISEIFEAIFAGVPE